MSMLHIVNEMRHTAKVPKVRHTAKVFHYLHSCLDVHRPNGISEDCQREDVVSSIEDTEKVLYPPFRLDVWCFFLTLTTAIAIAG